MKRSLSVLSLVTLLAPLAALAAPPTKTQVDTLMAALGKVTVDATPIGYDGAPPPASDCTAFAADVKAQLHEVISTSENAYDLLEHLSKAGKVTQIRCSSVRNGTKNLGHTWWTTGPAANVKNKAGTVEAECNSVVSLKQWQECVAKLSTGTGAFTAVEAVHAFSAHIQDVVIGIDHNTKAKAQPPTNPANKFVSLIVTKGAVTKVNCATAPNFVVDEDFGIILFHELIHASRMIDGKFIGGEPVTDANATDLAEFKTLLTTHNLQATVATANAQRANITLPMFQEMAKNAGYDKEELETVLTGGAVVGTKHVTENAIRGDNGKNVFRCAYNR